MAISIAPKYFRPTSYLRELMDRLYRGDSGAYERLIGELAQRAALAKKAHSRRKTA